MAKLQVTRWEEQVATAFLVGQAVQTFHPQQQLLAAEAVVLAAGLAPAGARVYLQQPAQMQQITVQEAAEGMVASQVL
jgi:hypothetical protein